MVEILVEFSNVFLKSASDVLFLTKTGWLFQALTLKEIYLKV